jgi:hypothetical protein
LQSPLASLQQLTFLSQLELQHFFPIMLEQELASIKENITSDNSFMGELLMVFNNNVISS